MIDVRTDPNVPPLPPHITFEQAKNFAQSMLKGDRRRWRISRQTVKHAVKSVLPGGSGND